MRELAVRNLRLEWDEGLPDFFTHGLWLEHCRDAAISGFAGGPNPGAAEAVAIAPSGHVYCAPHGFKGCRGIPSVAGDKGTHEDREAKVLRRKPVLCVVLCQHCGGD